MNLHHLVVILRNTSSLVILTIQLLLKLVDQLLTSLLLLLKLLWGMGRIADINQIAGLAIYERKSQVLVSTLKRSKQGLKRQTFGAELI